MSLKNTLFIFLFLSVSAIGKVQNEGLKTQLKGTGAYGFAGCGFGSMMFEPKENQLLALTSNHITSSQAFGISSGTSNCVASLPVHIDQAQRLPDFIETNKDKLSVEASRGQGETINALSVLLECKPQEVGVTLKENYKKIFIESKMESATIEANIHNLIEDNQKCF